MIILCFQKKKRSKNSIDEMNKKIDFLNFKSQEWEKEVYSKFSFKEVWDFINPNNLQVYEIRMKAKDPKIKIYSHIKKLANVINVPYHWTGVFITNESQFKACCIFGIKMKFTMYLSINPKRKSHHGKDNISWMTYNGKKQSELGYYNVFFDFDPTKKLKEKTTKTAEMCYRQAKKFLNENKNIKSYMLMCSGNGIQIRVPMDSPIMIPEYEYDEKNQIIETDETDTYGSLMKTAMQHLATKYSTSNVDVDITGFEIARVGRLPFSRNFKKDSPKSAGVIEIVNDEKNIGLYDYIMNFWDSVLEDKKKIKQYSDKRIYNEFAITEDNIKNSPFIKMLLKEELPVGGRNNVLFFQLKILLNNNKINYNNPKIKDLIRDIERVQNHFISMNPPDENIKFNPNAIINWCVNHAVKPIYTVLYDKKIKKRVIDNVWFIVPNKNKIFINKKLPNHHNIITRIIFYIKNNINQEDFKNKYILLPKIAMFMDVLANTYNVKYINYLIKFNILKTIFEKI